MRKLIAGLAGAAMVASMVAPAFASTSTDVKGTSSENAVAQLEALGVVTGDAGTGNFRPNDTITRGEFAVIADRLAGLGNAAQYLGQVDTSFKDVKKDYWGSGWVNVAKNAGLVAGYGDGTFQPNNPVTYAEVATVYLHLLNYSEKNLGGAWPTNDIIKFAALGLDSGVSFDANKPATRGDVAKMAQSLLGTKLATWDSTNNYYTTTGNPTLQHKVYGTDVQQFVVVATPNTLTKGSTTSSVATGKVELSTLSGSTATYSVSSSANFVGATSFDGLVGKEVNVVFDSNNNVVFAAPTSGVNNVVTGSFSAASTNVTNLNAATLGNSTVSSNNYTEYYYNGQLVANLNDAALTSVPSTAIVTAMNDANGHALSLFVQNYDVTAGKIASITSGSTTTQVAFDTTFATANYGTKTYANVDSTTPVTLNGAVSSVSQLQAGDIVYVSYDSASHASKLDAYRQTVTGTVSNYATGTTNTITVNGTSYALANASLTGSVAKVGDNVTLTLGQNNTVVNVVDNTGSGNVLTDAYLVSSTPSVAKYDPTTSVVTTYNKYTFYSAATGKQADYYVLPNNTTAHTGDYDLTNGVGSHKFFTNVTFDGSGNVKSAAVDTYDVSGTVAASGINTSAWTITLTNGTTYQVSPSTEVIDQSQYLLDNTKPVVGTTKLGDLAAGATVTLVTNGASNYSVKAIVVNTKGTASTTAASNVSGLFEGYSVVNNGTATTSTLTLNVNGTTKNFTVSSDVTSTYLASLQKGALVQLQDTNTDGTYDTVLATKGVNGLTSVANDVYNETVTTPVGTSTFSTSSGRTYYVDSNTVFYTVDSNGNVTVSGLGDLNTIPTGDEVTVVKGTNYSGSNFHADAVVIGPLANN